MAEENYLNEFLSLVQVDRFKEHCSQDITSQDYYCMPLKPIVDAEHRLREKDRSCLAYFSMEFGLATSFYNSFCSLLKPDQHNCIPSNTIFSNYRLADYFFDIRIDKLIDLPIYSGGLGVLAGDTIKTMADYRLPAVGIGILWHSGYFKQRFWYKYGQVPEKMHWHPRSYPGLVPLKNIVKIQLKNESVYLRLWKYYVYNYNRDAVIPLILLDSDVQQNGEHIRGLTDQLYRSDNAWIKIMQRIVLGFGGIAALKELGYNIDIFHLNEGHAVFSFLEHCRGLSPKEIEGEKHKFVYTCHTPVAAGHDRFSQENMRSVLSDEDFALVSSYGREDSGMINLTLLSMNVCSSINAVSKSHQQVMFLQFPEYKDRIRYVTNGVHPYTWISPEFLNVFRQFPAVFEKIDENPMILSRATELKADYSFRRQVWGAHQQNKAKLCGRLEKWNFKEDVFTVCWARRIAGYKRPSLILYDTDKLVEIAKNTGPLQIIIAGKAHPQDNLGFTFISEIMDAIDSLTQHYDYLKVIIMENYDMHLAQALISSVDLWLNNPLPPFEASGTSGMKAILNGVVQLTTLDGWVVEAEDKNIGRIFGYRSDPQHIGNEKNLHMDEDSASLYKNLQEMAALYYRTNRSKEIDFSSPWIDAMINCIAAGAYFNTYRMLDEYKKLIWKIA